MFPVNTPLVASTVRFQGGVKRIKPNISDKIQVWRWGITKSIITFALDTSKIKRLCDLRSTKFACCY